MLTRAERVIGAELGVVRHVQTSARFRTGTEHHHYRHDPCRRQPEWGANRSHYYPLVYHYAFARTPPYLDR
jgi:hypothetical protein